MEIPSNVTDIRGMFKNCSSFNQNIVIPDTITDLTETFSGCTSLTEVTLQIPVEKVADGTVTMTNAFQNCSSLTKVNVPAITVNKTSTWNAWRIIPDSTNHQASVQCFDYQGNAKFLDSNQQPQDVIVPYGNSTDLIAKIKTNLLSFANVTDEQIKKVMTSLYSFTKNNALDPDKKSFVLWGKEDETTHKANFVTNLTLSGEVIDDSTTRQDRTWSSSKIVNAIYPVGFVYMQPYRTPNPAEMQMAVPENCAWVDISDKFSGDYFRVENPRYHKSMRNSEVTVVSRNAKVLTLNRGDLTQADCWNGDIVRYNGYLAYVTARTEETIDGVVYNKTLTLDRELSIPNGGKVTISQGDAIQRHKHTIGISVYAGAAGGGIGYSVAYNTNSVTSDMKNWSSDEIVRPREETRVQSTFMTVWQVQEI